ncbi:DEAD/DEAH box helicase [Ghiorsea bivora]|uniref:DEAD/DEAH box helicase n=1 Tax=Ghiorsea bivora TaxID=1485545 RepID=UPI00068FA6FA|nr:DEAD/DEAH box helicase [Ghiorsea bivora]
MTFQELGLSKELLQAVSNSGYTTPTPVQANAIPAVLNGDDVLAGAQTGTGKTAGFTLPMLHLLQAKAGKTKHIRALVLTPTRELAAQIGESVETYGKYLPIRSTVVFGGVGINPQIAQLRRGVDILVATPGRLLDLVNQGKADLSKIEFFVLDEADRMLDMGFIHDIRKVLKLLPKKRQNLLFSATFSNEIKRLAGGFLHSPTFIEVARNETSHQVTQVVYPVNKSQKRAVLSKLISEGNWQQVLVFTKTKHGANRLTKQLETDGINAAAIHGNKSQTARTKALAGFKDGTIRVLVATDIAARGLDIDQLPHVVNYELPNVAEDYVHRIGRTGRAGNTGEAMSLVSIDEDKLLRGIERLIKKSIPKVTIEGFEATEKLADVAKDKPQRSQQPRGRNRRPQGNKARRPQAQRRKQTVSA